MWDIIGTLIAGLIIGSLGQLVVPGQQKIPIWLTWAAGLAGVIFGNVIATIFDWDTGGIDWWRWIVSILAAAVAVVLAVNWHSKRQVV